MRYPIDEKSGKPYGMPKGKKASQPEEVDLVKSNEQRLALASLDVNKRKEALKPSSKHEPVKEKEKGEK